MSECEYCRHITKALVMIQETNDLLLKALEEYADHFESCSVEYFEASNITVNCDCGLDEVFKKVEKKFH